MNNIKLIEKPVDEWKEIAKGLQKILAVYIIDVQENESSENKDVSISTAAKFIKDLTVDLL